MIGDTESRRGTRRKEGEAIRFRPSASLLLASKAKINRALVGSRPWERCE
jgi:hypothetical protein